MYIYMMMRKVLISIIFVTDYLTIDNFESPMGHMTRLKFLFQTRFHSRVLSWNLCTTIFIMSDHNKQVGIYCFIMVITPVLVNWCYTFTHMLWVLLASLTHESVVALCPVVWLSKLCYHRWFMTWGNERGDDLIWKKILSNLWYKSHLSRQ